MNRIKITAPQKHRKHSSVIVRVANSCRQAICVQSLVKSGVFTTRKRSLGKVIFSQGSGCPRGGSLSLCLGGLCIEGSMSRVVSVQWGLCPVGLLSGGSLSRGVSVYGDPPGLRPPGTIKGGRCDPTGIHSCFLFNSSN